MGSAGETESSFSSHTLRLVCRHRPIARDVRLVKSLCLSCFRPPPPKFKLTSKASARPSRFCGTRKRSVPVRVHSVDKSCGFVGARCQAAAVQPVFDSRHGRIACKLSLAVPLRSKFKGVRPPPISPEGCAPTPFSGWRPRSKIQVLIWFWPVAQTSV